MPHSLKKKKKAEVWVFQKEKEGGTQLPICVPSSCPTPGSQSLARLRLSFFSLEWGWALYTSPSHGLLGAAFEQLCPVPRAVSLCCGLKYHSGSCLFHHSLAHSLRGPPRSAGPFPLLAELGCGVGLGGPIAKEYKCQPWWPSL